MPTDPAQLFINTSNDPGLIVGPRVDASGALRYPTDEPQSSNTIVNIIQYNLNTIGANNQVLINKDNVATGDAELTYDADTNILTTETLNVGNLVTAFSANLGNIANVKITGGSNGFVLKTDGSGNLTWASQTVSTPTWSSITGKPTFATVATSGDYNDLLNLPSGGATTTYVDNKVANVTWANLSGAPTLATVATSGRYTDLANVPNLMGVALSGNYNDLSNRPSIPSIDGLASETYVDNKIANVTYANLSGTPTFATVATSGLYADLTYPTYVAENDLPDAANNAGMFAYVSQTGHGYVSNSTSWVKLGNFDDLPDLTDYALVSSIPAAQIQSDWTQTDDGQKDFIKNKPALFSGSYTDLANLPSLFSGSYADLSNQPTIPTNLDSLSNVIITSATNGEVLKFNGSDWVNGTPSSELSKTYTAGSVVQNTNLSVQPQEISLNASLDPGIDSFGSAITKVKLDNGAVNISSLEQDFPDIVYKTEINVSYYDGVTITNSPGPDDTKTWNFKNNGQLQLPVGGDIVDSTGASVLGGGGASTGNITFSDATLTSTNGDVKIHFSPSASPAVEFNFASNGTLTLPGGIVIQNNEVKNTGELSGEVQITTATTQGDTEKNWAFNHNGTGALIVPEGSSVQSKSNFNITATETGFIKFTNIVDFDTNSTVDDNQISIVNPEASILDLIDPASANYAGGLGSVVRIVYGPFRSAVGTIIEAFVDPGTTDPLTGLPRYQGRIDIVNPHNGDVLKEFSIEHSSTWKFGSDGTTTFPNNTISNPNSLLIKSGIDTAQVGSTRTISTDSNEGTGAGTPGVVDVAYDNTIIPTYYYPGGGAPNFTDSTITFQNGDVRTITSIIATGGYIEISYSGTTTSSPEFPIILKTGNYEAATTAPEWTFGTNGNLTLPSNTSKINYANGTSILSGLGAGGSGIALTDISVGADNSASGGGDISYDNMTGVFTYTPPDLSSYVTSITNIFDQDLNTSNNVTFNQVTPTELRQNSSRTVSTIGVTVPGATPTVVFSADFWFTSIKLVITVEGRLDGDTANVDHTQTCEATIAATYNTTAEPIISVYGIVYTSPAPLATFTVARNTVAGTIEVTAINSQTTNALDVRVHAIQFVSTYD